ncbi:hypothetical protein ABW19_dt0206162 [Dactylella cylindrospora]|nr:hypothetical protein ABW19_dt0206162 [Dactylella cylindrospora]
MQTLVVQGEYKLSVLSGTISIGGSILSTSTSLDVIAPTTQALPVIECAQRSKKRKLEKASNEEGGYDAVFALQSIYTGLSEIGRICPKFDRIWRPPLTSTTVQMADSESFSPILSSIQYTPTLSIPSSWQSTLATLSSSKGGIKVIFIIGSKSVGKSTFGRYLLNTLTSQLPSRPVAYIDLDPGQPSFTPPCIISLHKIASPIVSPPFGSFKSTELLRQHHIGYTSPREDPKYYLRCAADLVGEYRRISELGEPLTLLVNTCGWIKGMGLELLRELVPIFEPSDIVGLGDVEGAFAGMTHEGMSVKKHFLEAGGSGAAGSSGAGVGGGGGGGGGGPQVTPADLRTLQTISYFHSIPKDTENPNSAGFDFSTHLTAVEPVIASYRGQNKAIDVITVLDAEISQDLVSTAINATTVAVNLIKGDDTGHPVIRYLEDAQGGVVGGGGAGGAGNGENITPLVPSNLFEGTSDLLPPERTITLGLAIIRGMDEEKGEIQLLTPIREDALNRWMEEEGYRVVLCRGRDEMPVWLMWDWREGRGRRRGTGSGTGNGNGKTPYLDFVFGGEVGGKGAKEWKVRRNIMRKSQQRR